MEIRVNKIATLNLDFDASSLTNKQKWAITKHYASGKFSVDESVKLISAYAESLMGKRPTFAYPNSFKKALKDPSIDRLESKKPNSILDQMLERYDIKKSKSPNAIISGNALGIEIECIIPSNWDRDNINAEVKKRRIKNVQLKDDGSINDFDNDEYYGKEFTIITDINDMSNLKALCEFLDEMGAYVNETCGLHVHLDCRDIVEKSYERHPNDSLRRSVFKKANSAVRANKLVWALPILTKMLPKSRLDNSYCKYGKSKGRGRESRYFMVNTQSLTEHGTIEIRAHSGTINFEKISQWARLCYAISRAKGARFTKLPNIVDSVSLSEAMSKLSSKASIAEDTLTYVLTRIKQFNPRLFEANVSLGNTPMREDSEEMPNPVNPISQALDVQF